MAIMKRLLRWRRKQKRGEIMKPSTFQEIVSKNAPEVGIERAKKIGGKAYWATAKAKFRNR